MTAPRRYRRATGPPSNEEPKLSQEYYSGFMFNPKAYGEEVARILALEGNGERLMPLAGQTCSSSEARDLVNQSKLPSLVRAGLYLYFGCWTEAHELVDDLETPDGM